ncbi:MerR family transcriptional regulator [Streptosporangium amethystogenes]|uniref:MerR family transcriptional regulator n=1 Tax=Streptosporangium amethystogenes TaxID=2002 RepID=UPI0005621A81|nr:MerR family transcriptional regulator [Streptosporangium amethystogenes]
MEWTIGELAERASAALAPTAQLNGRVRDVPNERLIRWYATIGLLDPPLARRGRVALYGRRHLLQLIAVKRRQADGRTIADIQAELTGATDQTLESIARIPEWSPEHAAETVSPRTARPRFWAEQSSAPAESGLTAPRKPAPPPKPAPAGTPPLPASSGGATPPPGRAEPRSDQAAPDRAAHDSAPSHRPAPWADVPVAVPRPAAETRPPAVIVHGVRLADGVTLLLDGGGSGGRPPSPDDLAEIAAASRELLSLLRERGLTPPEGTRP